MIKLRHVFETLHNQILCKEQSMKELRLNHFNLFLREENSKTIAR